MDTPQLPEWARNLASALNNPQEYRPDNSVTAKEFAAEMDVCDDTARKLLNAKVEEGTLKKERIRACTFYSPVN